MRRRQDPHGDAASGLVAAARRGEAWALEELWRAHAPAVAGYLRAHGAAESDDLTSEVFLGVFRALRQFVGDEDDLRAFVFTVAHHRLVDDMRVRRRRPRTVSYQPDIDRRVSNSAETDALAGVAEARARQVVAALPPDQREVMMLRFFGDLTVEQTAAALAKTENAVKALQHRALGRLRKILEQAVPL